MWDAVRARCSPPRAAWDLWHEHVQRRGMRVEMVGFGLALVWTREDGEWHLATAAAVRAAYVGVVHSRRGRSSRSPTNALMCDDSPARLSVCLMCDGMEPVRRGREVQCDLRVRPVESSGGGADSESEREARLGRGSVSRPTGILPPETCAGGEAGSHGGSKQAHPHLQGDEWREMCWHVVRSVRE